MRGLTVLSLLLLKPSKFIHQVFHLLNWSVTQCNEETHPVEGGGELKAVAEEGDAGKDVETQSCSRHGHHQTTNITANINTIMKNAKIKKCKSSTNQFALIKNTLLNHIQVHA